MRTFALLSVFLASGCGASLASSIEVWHPTGQRSALDAEDRALLTRMVVPEPTDDAIDAREHIDELGEVGDDDVRALLTSSLAWLDHLRGSGALARFRTGACVAPRSKGSPDVIAELANAGAEEVRVVPDFVYGVRPDAQARCARDRRTLRALAITRAWLAVHGRGAGVLAVFAAAIERLSGGPRQSCGDDSETDVMRAITRHYFELDPDASRAYPPPPAASCAVMTIAGPVGLVEPLDDGLPCEANGDPVDPGGPTPFSRGCARLVTIEQPQELLLEFRDGEWRIVDVMRFLCIDITTYRRGQAGLVLAADWRRGRASRRVSSPRRRGPPTRKSGALFLIAPA